eukprot:GILK01005833.1.p1 GENE.GILK01005833.1~~GILK01005833.1.p1  ORF type:complete len:371 (+),score=47.31 GILK01005833.1:49-1161(+)
MASSSNAFLTLVMVGDNYVCGALVLGWSLRKVNTTAHLAVMVTNDVSAEGRAALETIFDSVIEVPYLEAEAIQRSGRRFEHMYRWLDKCFTKFNMFKLTQFDKVAFLDADMLAVANPDDLFQLDCPAGICSVVTDDTKWHGKILPSSIVRRSMSDYGIRGCLHLVHPNLYDYEAMMDKLAGGTYGTRDKHIGPDERLITEYYLSQWTHVHKQYGCHSWKTNELQGAEPKMLHFVSEKPWVSDNDWPDFALWNRTAESLLTTHPQLRKCFAPKVLSRLSLPEPSSAPEVTRSTAGTEGIISGNSGDSVSGSAPVVSETLRRLMEAAKAKPATQTGEETTKQRGEAEAQQQGQHQQQEEEVCLRPMYSRKPE